MVIYQQDGDLRFGLHDFTSLRSDSGSHAGANRRQRQDAVDVCGGDGRFGHDGPSAVRGSCTTASRRAL